MSMRIPFALVELQLQKLYDFSIVNENEIVDRCELITEFVEACGWTIEDYTKTLILGEGVTN